jgi:hypothetical protein
MKAGKLVHIYAGRNAGVTGKVDASNAMLIMARVFLWHSLQVGRVMVTMGSTNQQAPTHSRTEGLLIINGILLPYLLFSAGGVMDLYAEHHPAMHFSDFTGTSLYMVSDQLIPLHHYAHGHTCFNLHTCLFFLSI